MTPYLKPNAVVDPMQANNPCMIHGAFEYVKFREMRMPRTKTLLLSIILVV